MWTGVKACRLRLVRLPSLFPVCSGSLGAYFADLPVGHKFILLSYGEQGDGETLYESGSDDFYNMFFLECCFYAFEGRNR